MDTQEQAKQQRRIVTLTNSTQKFRNHLYQLASRKPQQQPQDHHQALQPSRHQNGFHGHLQALPFPSHAQQLHEHRLKYPLYNPELEQVSSDLGPKPFFNAHDTPTTAPGAHYPDLAPGFNQVSHHLLDTTAFTHDSTISPSANASPGDTLRALHKDVPSSYAAISADATNSFSPLLEHLAIKLDHLSLDFDRLDILYEYGSFCYVMYPSPAQPHGVASVFLRKQYVNTALVSEWESVVKRPVGTYGVGGTAEYDGSWHVHGKHGVMREKCADAAWVLEKARRESDKEVVEKVFGAAMERRFGGILVEYFRGVEEEVERERREAERAWGEFMVGDDDG